MEWASIDRYTGLQASGATSDKVIRLAFKPGTVPAVATEEDVTKIREAREKANSQLPENRLLGQQRAIETPNKDVNLEGEDPNKN
jgi:hypothetical protein